MRVLKCTVVACMQLFPSQSLCRFPRKSIVHSIYMKKEIKMNRRKTNASKSRKKRKKKGHSLYWRLHLRSLIDECEPCLVCETSYIHIKDQYMTVSHHHKFVNMEYKEKKTDPQSQIFLKRKRKRT